MSAHILVTGVLFRAPQTKTSKAGKSFTTATLKAKDGEATQWWKVLAFSESACAELARLSDGDALSVQGALKAETYEKDGATKVSLTCIADTVLALRQPARKRAADKSNQNARYTRSAPRAKHATDSASRAERCAGDGVDVFGDTVPF